MALGRRGGERQEALWIPTGSVARGSGHPFFDRLNELLAEAGFDRRFEERCRPYYAAQGAGIEEPSDDDLKKFDQKRKGKTLSNEEWRSSTDADGKIAKMKDGTTHIACKVEHAVDLESELLRTRGRRGRRLQRPRRVLCERSFAHTCEAGAGRRSWLRELVNVAQRYVIHAAAYNLGVILQTLFWIGTPRSLQGRAVAACAALLAILRALYRRLTTRATGPRHLNPIPTPITPTPSRLAAA